MIYNHSIEFEVNNKDISKEDINELEDIILTFLNDKGYENVRTHRVGLCDLKLNPIWKSK